MNNKIKRFDNFPNKKQELYDIKDKLDLLKSYIIILKNAEKELDKDYSIQKTYFIIIYNFLIVESIFYEDVKLNKKEINKFLILTELHSVEEVLELFIQLYDSYNNVRFAVETFDSIESIRNYLSDKKPEIHNKLIKR